MGRTRTYGPSQSERCKHTGTPRAASTQAETLPLAANSAANHLLVDEHGLSLVAQISGAQAHHSRFLIPLVESSGR